MQNPEIDDEKLTNLQISIQMQIQIERKACRYEFMKNGGGKK